MGCTCPAATAVMYESSWNFSVMSTEHLYDANVSSVRSGSALLKYARQFRCDNAVAAG